MANERGGGGFEFLAGLVVGGLVGAVVGLLMAPQSGEETRSQLGERGIELRDEFQRRAGEVQERVPAFVDEQRGRVQEAIERGREAAARKQREILSQLEAQRRAAQGSEPDGAGTQS